MNEDNNPNVEEVPPIPEESPRAPIGNIGEVPIERVQPRRQIQQLERDREDIRLFFGKQIKIFSFAAFYHFIWIVLLLRLRKMHETEELANEYEDDIDRDDMTMSPYTYINYITCYELLECFIASMSLYIFLHTRLFNVEIYSILLRINLTTLSFFSILTIWGGIIFFGEYYPEMGNSTKYGYIFYFFLGILHLGLKLFCVYKEKRSLEKNDEGLRNLGHELQEVELQAIQIDLENAGFDVQAPVIRLLFI